MSALLIKFATSICLLAEMDDLKKHRNMDLKDILIIRAVKLEAAKEDVVELVVQG
jgi:hypothetical protein